MRTLRSCMSLGHLTVDPGSDAGTGKAQQRQFLTRPSHFIYCIPTGATRAQRLARIVAEQDHNECFSSRMSIAGAWVPPRRPFSHLAGWPSEASSLAIGLIGHSTRHHCIVKQVKQGLDVHLIKTRKRKRGGDTEQLALYPNTNAASSRPTRDARPFKRCQLRQQPGPLRQKRIRYSRRASR